MTRIQFDAVVPFEQLRALRAHYRAAGKTIVSTNGCFDLLHAGHAQMLRQARALGDVLVVGVNDDESVRRLKGPTRPVVGQADRAALLGELKCVDHAVIFTGLLPNAMLEALEPDIHCKAADYDADSLPEAEVVRRHGGRIHILPLRQGYSTSRLLGRSTGSAGGESGGGVTSVTVLDQLLNSANLQRQAAYRLAASVEQALRVVEEARRADRKVLPAANKALSSFTAGDVVLLTGDRFAVAGLADGVRLIMYPSAVQAGVVVETRADVIRLDAGVNDPVAAYQMDLAVMKVILGITHPPGRTR